MKLFFRSKSEKDVVESAASNATDRSDVPVKSSTSRGMSKQGSKGGLFSKNKSKNLAAEDAQGSGSGSGAGSGAGGSGSLQRGKSGGTGGAMSRGKSKSGVADAAGTGTGNPAASAGQAPPKSGPPQARGAGPYIPGQTPPPSAAKSGPASSNAAGAGSSSGDGSIARTKSGKPVEGGGGNIPRTASGKPVQGGGGDIARTKSGKAIDGAGGDIARTKSGKIIEEKDPKDMSIDEMNEKSKLARVAAEQVEKENEELEAQAPPVEQILSEDQRLEDERIRCEHSLEKAKKLLKSVKAEKKMLDEGVATTGAIMAVERVGEKIKLVEDEEMGERHEYEAMIKAIADQEHIINSLVSQIRRNPKLREPNMKVPPRFRVEYTPPPFRDWKVEKDYILKGLQPPTPAEIKRSKSGGSGSGSKGSKGAGIGSAWSGALPDASRGSAINREGSGSKKQSKWEVKTNTLSKSASLQNDADKDRVSRENSSNIVHANEHSELDALKEQQSSVRNLFSRFDSGEIQQEAEKEHASKFANKEFDKSVFDAREQERAKALGSRHSSGKGAPNDAMRELEELKRMGSANRDVIAAFEEGEIARQDSHDAEFKNKEMDFHERSVHVSKKFLL